MRQLPDVLALLGTDAGAVAGSAPWAGQDPYQAFVREGVLSSMEVDNRPPFR
jgi:hypothetical protein